MSVNLTSAHILVRELLPLLRASETPSITTVASSLGYQVMPGMGAYAASKGALVSLTKAFAMELAPHVRANVVAPGAVETAFLGGGTGREDIVSDRGWFDQLSDKYVSSIPLGRVASPADIVGPSCFFPDRVPATSRAGPASERRQVDPLKVEDGYAATRASVFDRTTAGYLSRLFAAFERANARILSDLDWQLNVPYGRDPRETFDLCRAPALALGTVLFFHGGYWQSRDKSQFRFMAGAWAKAGFNVALAGYRLCPDISVRDLTASIQAVPLAVVHALPATQRNLPIILAGHSAGAHLAIELALAWKTRNPATATLAGVAISGIYDLTPLVPTTLNERLRLDLSQARQCSPIFRVQGGISPRHSWSAARKPQPSCGKAGKWRNTGPRMAIPPLTRRFTGRITSACSRC